MAKPPGYWVLRGARGSAARQKLLDTMAGLGEQRAVGAPSTNRPASIKLYITPFSIDLGDEIVVTCSALQPSWSLMAGFTSVNTRTKTTLATTDSAVRLKGFKPARVIRRQTTSAAGSVARSKRTGLSYIKYAGSSTSIPLGKKGTDTQGSAFQDVLSQAGAGLTNVKFSLINEDA